MDYLPLLLASVFHFGAATLAPLAPTEVSCDFTKGMCGYEVETSGKFQWKRVSTAQGLIMWPAGDKPNKDDYFMRAMTFNGSSGEQTRLVSKPMEAVVCRLRFRHHLAKDVGTLAVKVRDPTGRDHAVWTSASGAVDGGRWLTEFIDLPYYGNNSRVVFEATKGINNSAVAPFVLNDVDAVIGGGCDLRPPPTAAPPAATTDGGTVPAVVSTTTVPDRCKFTGVAALCGSSGTPEQVCLARDCCYNHYYRVCFFPNPE